MSVLFTRRGKAAPVVKYVEYVQTRSGQYIDTQFKPNNNTRVVMDAQMVGATSVGTYYLPFGARGGGYFFELFKASQSNWELTFLWGTTYPKYFTIDYSKRYVFEINKNTATVGTESYTYSNVAFQLNYSLYLGADNNGGSLLAPTPIKIYSCQIYDNGVLVRDYRPCIDPDGKGCLYEEVSQTYVYSADGSELYTPDTVPDIEVGTVYTFTANGTFTVPVDGSYSIEMHGGGGGGGSDGYVDVYYWGGGGGGGSGEMYQKTLTKGESYAITIGSGGAKTSSTGATGGTTSFGSLFSLAGGSGGQRVSNGVGGYQAYGGAKAGSLASAGSPGNTPSAGAGGYGNTSKPAQTYGNGGNGGQAGKSGAVIITFLG